MIGTDIIEIDRIKDALVRYGDKFKARVYTQAEIAYCDASKKPEERYAARFAAKEAVAKALQVDEGWSWQEIEILKKESGAPYVVLHGKLKERCSDFIHISMSHSQTDAIAVSSIYKK